MQPSVNQEASMLPCRVLNTSIKPLKLMQDTIVLYVLAYFLDTNCGINKQLDTQYLVLLDKMYHYYLKGISSWTKVQPKSAFLWEYFAIKIKFDVIIGH